MWPWGSSSFPALPDGVLGGLLEGLLHASWCADQQDGPRRFEVDYLCRRSHLLLLQVLSERDLLSVHSQDV